MGKRERPYHTHGSFVECKNRFLYKQNGHHPKETILKNCCFKTGRELFTQSQTFLGKKKKVEVVEIIVGKLHGGGKQVVATLRQWLHTESKKSAVVQWKKNVGIGGGGGRKAFQGSIS